MMGDAGSRAMGLFISIAILKTGCPLLYIPLAIVLILDGGARSLKVSLLRFFKNSYYEKCKTSISRSCKERYGTGQIHSAYSDLP